MSQKVSGAEKAWEPAPTPSTTFWAGSCLCTAVLNPCVLNPKAKLQPSPYPTSQGQLLRGCYSATKNRARAQLALGKALPGRVGLLESGKKMGKVQMYLTRWTQGFLGSIYCQAVNGEHLQTMAQPGFVLLLPAKEV